MQELISMREYARRRDVSHVAIIKAVRTGRITLVNGKIDPVLADKSWRGLTDPSNSNSRSPGQEKTGVTEGASKPLIDKAEKVPPAGHGAGDNHQPPENRISYADQRAIREGYNARIAKLDYEERAGKLINADQVRVEAFNAARSARDRLMAMPSRLASIFSGMTDEREIERIMSEELRKICHEFTKPTNGAG